MSEDTYTNTVQAVALAVAANQPLILWGEPGTGKTSFLNAMAASMDRPIDSLIAAICDPTDFQGLPFPHDGQTAYLPPSWAVRKADEGNGIMFFDELSLAPPAVQNAMLRVLLEKRVGELFMGDGTAMVAAANPVDTTSNAWELSSALANRMLHIDWELPPAVVTAGLTFGFPDVEAPTVNHAAVERNIVNAQAVIAAFLTAQPHMTHRRPESVAHAGLAWPSPRSWHVAATMIGWAEAANASVDVRRILVVAAVGQAAAAEFLEYADKLDLPDPEDVLANPSSWTITNRNDRTHATITSVLLAVADKPTEKRWAAVGQVMEHMTATGQCTDVAVEAARRWLDMRNRRWNIAAAVEPLEVLTPTLKKAGLIH